MSSRPNRIADYREVAPQPDLRIRALQRACEKLGGLAHLAHVLGVPVIHLIRCLDGDVRVPENIFLKCVDVIIE